MRVFQTKYTNSEGKKKGRRNWRVYFRDHCNVTHRLAAFADKQASVDLGRNLDRLSAGLKAGEKPDLEMTRWIQTLPVRITSQLAQWGLLDTRTTSAKKRVSKHVEDYKRALIDQDKTKQHASLTANRVLAIAEATGAVFLSELSAAKVEAYLANRRREGMSKKSSNHYLASIKAFCNWLVEQRRLRESMVAHLKPVNAKTDRKRQRRALSDDELRQLLEITRSGPFRYKSSGPDRATLYRLAMETGLRAGELRSLNRENFKLDGDPSVTVVAGSAKNRREDTLPLRADLAAELRGMLSGKMPNVRAFALPGRDYMADMLRADLDDARNSWINEAVTAQGKQERTESDFLAYLDHSGRHFDFHALRHQFASNLAAAKVHPKTAQEVLRHSSIELTMGIYTHSFRGDKTAAIAKLPDLSEKATERKRATGTDDVSADLGCVKNCANLDAKHSDSVRIISEKVENGSTDSRNAKPAGPTTKVDSTTGSDNWERLDSNQRRRTPTGLQPVPFGQLGHTPKFCRR